MKMELKGTASLIKALDKAATHAPHAMASAMYVEASAIMAKSVDLAPVGVSGALRASHFVGTPTVTATGASVRFGYGGMAGAYAVYIHEGTGPAVGNPPFFPPPDAFLDWVRLKGVAAQWGMEDEDAAYLVARSVGAKGLAPRKFLTGPLKQAKRGMAGRLASRVRGYMKAKMGGG